MNSKYFFLFVVAVLPIFIFASCSKDKLKIPEMKNDGGDGGEINIVSSPTDATATGYYYNSIVIRWPEELSEKISTAEIIFDEEDAEPIRVTNLEEDFIIKDLEEREYKFSIVFLDASEHKSQAKSFKATPKGNLLDILYESLTIDDKNQQILINGKNESGHEVNLAAELEKNGEYEQEEIELTKSLNSMVFEGLNASEVYVLKLVFTDVTFDESKTFSIEVTPKEIEYIKKVLHIGLDGLAFEDFERANTPILTELFQNSWLSTNAIAETGTWSGNGWAATFTGTHMGKHWVYNNNESTGQNSNLANYPSFFKRLKDYNADLRTVSIESWGFINKYINKSDFVTNSFTVPDPRPDWDAGDEEATKQAIEELKNNTPDVMFLYYLDIDETGHSDGFGSNSYIKAIERVDEKVGRVLEAVKKRSTYDYEDWMIIVSTDHGAREDGSGHGSNTEREIKSFIAVNHKSIKPKSLSKAPEVKTKSYSSTALEFGDEFYGVLPNVPELNFGEDKSFTMELRVRPTILNNDGIIIGNKNWVSGNNPGILIGNDAGKTSINISSPSHRKNMPQRVYFDDGHWHHITMTVDRVSGWAKLYDGGHLISQVDAEGIGSINSVNDYPFVIGQDGTTNYGHGYAGNILEIRFFNEVVDPRSIREYATKNLDNKHPSWNNVIGYWPGTDGSGSKYAMAHGVAGDIEISSNSGSTQPSWETVSDHQLRYWDFYDSPYLFDIPTIIFDFLEIPIQNGWGWSGKNPLED